MSAKRILGLELSGAKNNRTTLAVMEYFPKEKKIFLRDLIEKLGPSEKDSADALLVREIKNWVRKNDVLVTSAGLTLPPCLPCGKTCRKPDSCTLPEARWMRQFHKKVTGVSRPEGPRIRDFTSYTQRPVELWLRYSILSKLHPTLRFDIDETLGGSRGPLTARMVYLKPFLKGLKLLEASPKLTLSRLADPLHLSKRSLRTYRSLESGASARREILEHITQAFDLFIYTKDLRRLRDSLPVFDAFICAITGYLSITNQVELPPKGFPVDSGWIHYPRDDFQINL